MTVIAVVVELNYTTTTTSSIFSFFVIAAAIFVQRQSHSLQVLSNLCFWFLTNKLLGKYTVRSRLETGSA